MHRGCFVWTPTPPLSGRRTPRPCACRAWPGRAGRPPWRVLVCLTFPLAGLGALFACLAPSGLGLTRSWLLLGCFFFSVFFPPPPRCASFVSCFACFPASGALGLGVLLPPPPPPPLFFPPPPWLRPRCLLLCVFSGLGCLGPWRHVAPPPPSPPFLFFAPPPLTLAFPVFWPRVPWASAPYPHPPLFFLFFFLLFLVSSFSVFFPFFFCRLCGAGRVCVSWAVGCARVCLVGAVPVVALCALAGVVWCWLLGLAVLCCLLVGLGVVFRWCCPCLAAWLAALWFGVVCLGVPLPCVVFCCAVLSCGGVLLCSDVCLRRCLCLLFVSCRCVSAVCVLCVFWGVVLCVPCPLRPVRCLAALWWCPFVVLCASSVLFLVAGVVGSWCRCLLLGVYWWLWLPGVVVWWCVLALLPVSGPAVARLLPCGVLLPCVVSCGAVLPCGAVLWCPVFFFCFSPCWWRWVPVVPCWFWAPGRFRVVSVSVLCLCGAVLVCLRCCSLCGALLPLRGWLVFCVVACCVRVFAVGPGCPLLSPGGSWWLLVSCLGGVLWCVPGCSAAPCRCALCRLALRCCALCCFVLLRLVLPRTVLCSGALSVVLGSCAFWRRVLSCHPALCVFCCGVSLRGVVRRCALCRVHPGVSCCVFPVVSALCGVAVWPALPRCPAPLCCAPVVLCCRVVPWCPVLPPCWVCLLRGCGCTYLKNCCKSS